MLEFFGRDMMDIQFMSIFWNKLSIFWVESKKFSGFTSQPPKEVPFEISDLLCTCMHTRRKNKEQVVNVFIQWVRLWYIENNIVDIPLLVIVTVAPKWVTRFVLSLSWENTVQLKVRINTNNSAFLIKGSQLDFIKSIVWNKYWKISDLDFGIKSEITVTSCFFASLY